MAQKLPGNFYLGITADLRSRGDFLATAVQQYDIVVFSGIILLLFSLSDMAPGNGALRGKTTLVAYSGQFDCCRLGSVYVIQTKI